MEKKEVFSLLRLLSNLWPNITLTDDLVDAWFWVLESHESVKVMAATKYIINTKESDFPPNASQIVKAIADINNSGESAEIAWDEGGYSSEFAKHVWRRWGGDRRFGSLPDPKYSPEPLEAERTLSFARKEFIDLYNSMKDRKDIGIAKSELQLLEDLGLKSKGLPELNS